jgi:hypothetical protein
MMAVKLVRLIERNSELLAHSLIQKVAESHKCEEMRKVPRKELESRAFEVYQNLSDWLMNRTERDIERTYVELGKHRCRQGVAFNNVFWALILTKENLWDFLQRECVEETALDLHCEFELLRALDHFFDRAIYYLSVGYYQAHQEIAREHAVVSHA